MVSSRTSCWLRYKVNMPKLFCVTIQPFERYLSNDVWCILRSMLTDQPTQLLKFVRGRQRALQLCRHVFHRDVERGTRLIHCRLLTRV